MAGRTSTRIKYRHGHETDYKACLAVIILAMILRWTPKLGNASATTKECLENSSCATSPSELLQEPPNYAGFEKFAPFESDQEREFVWQMNSLMTPSANMSVNDFINNKRNMGNTMMQCSRIGGEGVRTFYKKTFGVWPAEVRRDRRGNVADDGKASRRAENVGVAVRSVSKFVIVAGFMALTERLDGERDTDRSKEAGVNEGLRLSLESLVGDFLPACRGTSLEYTSVWELLSLSGGLDNRLNVHYMMDRGDAVDHVGFPPYCDVEGLTPVECVEQVVCPAYKIVHGEGEVVMKKTSTALHTGTDALYGATQRGADSDAKQLSEYVVPGSWNVRDISCLKDKDICRAIGAGELACQVNVHLYQDCPLSCGMCCSSDDPMEDLVCEDDPALHARQSAQCGHDSRMPVAAFKEEDGEIIRRRMNGCTYDNYSYTVVDAMVVSLTGKQLWQWTLDLIARPLGMNDMIRCMMPPLEEGAGDSSSGIPGCYVPPSFSDMYDVTKWPLWKGGPESYAWPGVSIVCSSEDLTRFIGMLVGKGGVAGVTVLSEASVNEIFSHKSHYPNGHCMGMRKVCLGMGTCDELPAKGSACSAEHWWGWGGSYGSRFMIMPDAGVACVTLALMPNEMAVTSTDVPTRVASRQHLFAHTQASIARKIWPWPYLFADTEKGKLLAQQR